MERGVIAGGLLISVSLATAVLLHRWSLDEAPAPAAEARPPAACTRDATRPAPRDSAPARESAECESEAVSAAQQRPTEPND